MSSDPGAVTPDLSGEIDRIESGFAVLERSVEAERARAGRAEEALSILEQEREVLRRSVEAERARAGRAEEALSILEQEREMLREALRGVADQGAALAKEPFRR